MRKANPLLSFALLVAGLALATICCANSDPPPAPATATPPPPTATPVPPTPTATPASTVPAPTETPYTPLLEPTVCPFDVPAGATVECGFVVVPEDRYGDPADTIRLAVAVYRSTSDTPAPDPVIYLHGGPGGTVVERSAGFYRSFTTPLLKKRDVVFFDQRGSGLSEPNLDCWELKYLFLQDLKRDFSEEGGPDRYTTALLTCRSRLVLGGANPAAYTSAASAADVKDIAAVLGYEQVNLYGVSYGTRLAQTVMRDHPEVVRSAVLDSVIPIQVEPYDEAATVTATLKVLFDGCAADPACSTAYPDLETVFYDLVEQLNAEPVTLEVPNPLDGKSYGITVNGARFTLAVVWGLNSSYTIPIVPRAIYKVRAGDYESLGYAAALPLRAYENLSLGAMISVNCHEHIYATTPEALDDGPAEDLTAEALRFLSIDVEDLFALCDQWGAAPFDPRDGEPLTSDIPTLIIAGEYDPNTPPAYGRRVAETLSNSTFLEFPGQGHTPSLGAPENCALRIATAFLDEPATEPDSSCIARMAGPRFVVPARAEDIELNRTGHAAYGITSLVPRGWKYISSGFFNRSAYALDPTQLGVQSASVSTEEWLEWLTGRFQYTGLDGAPVFVGEHQADEFTWQLYTAEFMGNPVDIALAETGDRTLLVILLSERDERDVLYEAVFLPVVDSVALVEHPEE